MSLRQHLRGWALQHAPLLRQMRHAAPNDLAALIRVYPQEPLPGRYPGDPRLQEQGKEENLAFTGLSAPLTLSHLQHSHEAFAEGIREDFAKYRDFRLSQSINTGRSSVTLWASGRVTETTLVDQKVERGKPILMSRVESTDIALPYAFLFPQSVF